MSVKIPLQMVVVNRDGKNVRCKAGTPFEFSKEEVAEFERIEKDTGEVLVRDPIVEGAGAGVPKSVVNNYSKAVKAATEAAAKSAAKPNDEKLKDAYVKATKHVADMALEYGLEVPAELQAAVEEL